MLPQTGGGVGGKTGAKASKLPGRGPKNTFKKMFNEQKFKTLNISGIVMPGPYQDGYVPGQGK